MAVRSAGPFLERLPHQIGQPIALLAIDIERRLPASIEALTQETSGRRSLKRQEFDVVSSDHPSSI
jgi:hypothetical protein